MIRALSICLGVSILLLVIATKMALSYHEELSKATVITDQLSQTIEQTNNTLKLKEESCKISDDVVRVVIDDNNSLRESTEVLLDKLNDIQPVQKGKMNDKVIYSERIDPALYSLLKTSYCETSGDTDYCSTSKPAN